MDGPHTWLQYVMATAPGKRASHAASLQAGWSARQTENASPAFPGPGPHCVSRQSIGYTTPGASMVSPVWPAARYAAAAACSTAGPVVASSQSHRGGTAHRAPAVRASSSFPVGGNADLLPRGEIHGPQGEKRLGSMRMSLPLPSGPEGNEE